MGKSDEVNSAMTAKTRIYLIRHGEVEGADTARYNGHADVSLTERGKGQYRQLRERFADAAITACYTSDLFRCAWGAELLGVQRRIVERCDLRITGSDRCSRTTGRTTGCTV
jgi:broad specificity phosphatase PhoE